MEQNYRLSKWHLVQDLLRIQMGFYWDPIQLAY